MMQAVNEITISTELCTRASPALLALDKMSLHYVIHYIKRGTWDHLIPELTEEIKRKVEGYQCNVCGKKFRNNPGKGEFPARGSFICHWATEHGKVVEAMRRDQEMDMKSVLEVLRDQDERVRGFLETGTHTEHDQDPVKTLESVTWRIQVEPDVRDQQNRALKPTLSCPKCPKLDRNRCPDTMKLHIFQHYLDFWRDKVPRLERSETQCELCSPAKRIVGASSEGCRTSLICHRAIQHGELRRALAADQDLPRGFITSLLGDEEKNQQELIHEPTKKNDDNIIKKEVVLEEIKKDSTKERELIKEEIKRKVLQKLLEMKSIQNPGRGKKRKKLDKMQELEMRLAEKMRHQGNSF